MAIRQLHLKWTLLLVLDDVDKMESISLCVYVVESDVDLSASTAFAIDVNERRYSEWRRICEPRWAISRCQILDLVAEIRSK